VAAQNLLLTEFIPAQADFAEVTAICFAVFVTFICSFQFRIWWEEPDRLAETAGQRKALGMLFAIGFLAFFSLLFWQWGFEQFSLVWAISLGTSFAMLGLTPAFVYFVSLLLLRPWELGSNDDLLFSLPRASAMIVSTLFLIHLIRERAVRVFWTKECTILVAFALWLFLTSTQGSDPGEAQSFYWDNIARAVVVFFLTVNVLKNKRDLLVYQQVMISVALVVACLAIYYSQVLGHKDATSRLSYLGLLGDPNDISAFLLLVLPFAVKPFFSPIRKARRLIFPTVFFIVLLFLIYLAQSRGAIVGLLAFGACVVVDRSANKKRAVVLAMLLLFAYLPAKMLLHREEGDLKESGRSRLIYWQTGIQMAIKHPLVGVGFNDFPNQYQNYLTEPIADEFGKRTAHSSWVLVLSENGFPGFLLFLSLYLLSLRRAFRIRKDNPEYFYSLITYGVAMSFLSHAYLLFPYLIFSFVIVSDCVLTSQSTMRERRLSSSTP
jgi:O-antigen ligase